MATQIKMTFDRECLFCGQNFEAISPKAQFCCSNCRLRYFRFKAKCVDTARQADKAVNDLFFFLENQSTGEMAWKALVELQNRINAQVEYKQAEAVNRAE